MGDAVAVHEEAQDPFERARLAWSEGYAIIAAAVNQVLAEKKTGLKVQSPPPLVGATLLRCRLRLTDALIDVPNIPRRISRSVEQADWRPWFVGDINGDRTEAAGWVGCAYQPIGGDELAQILSLLRSRDHWTRDDWHRKIVKPVEDSGPRFERWLIEVKTHCASRPPATEKTEAVFLGNGRIRIGRQVVCLDGAQANVVQALVELQAATKRRLINHSGVGDAHQVLKKVSTSFPVLAPHIDLPGRRGTGGYRTSIRLAVSDD